MSAAADGIRDNGFRWNSVRLGVSAEAKKIGEIVDEKRPEDELEKLAESVVAKLRAYPCISGRMKRDFAEAADELEGIADCGIDEVTAVLGRVYDHLDYWRVLA